MSMITNPRAILTILTFLLGVQWTASAQVDGAYIGKLKGVLKELTSYRYGDISLFQVEKVFSQVTQSINPAPKDTSGALERLSKSTEKAQTLDFVRGIVRKNKTYDKTMKALEDAEQDGKISADEIADNDIQIAIQYFIEQMVYEKKQYKGAFLVTSKYLRGSQSDEFTVIGLVLTRSGSTMLDLKQITNPSDIITRAELMRLPPPENSKSATMYEYLRDQVIQNNLENITLKAQGIDDVDTRFVRQVFGNSIPIPEDDVQQFIKITNGIPVKYFGPNELTVSAADLISYRRYLPDVRPEIIKVMELDSTGAEIEVEKEVPTYNSRLAQYGFELRYGLEDINYPTLWSERMSLNAVWSQARLGVVLPTTGWSDVASSFGNARTMTNAGFGVNGSLEVPIKIIAESGVFNFAGSYVFNDANETNRQRFDNDLQIKFDHLVRFHASAQYTFAVKVDESNLFRFRLGGTGYSMERWHNVDTVTVNGADSTMFRKYDSKFIGGVSGKIEFMNTSWSTPMGASLQYFDESVLGNVWLQVQAAPSLGFRLDINMFAPIFREPRPWENSAVFMPSLRAIINF